MIDPENIEYETATVEQMVELALPLMQAHFKEAEHSLPEKELSLKLDMLKYLQENDKLLVVAGKDKTINKIVGYAAFMIEETLITDATIANELAVYVTPEYRNYGIAATLLTVAEILLKDKGVSLMKMILKDKNQGMHSEIYELGYELEELVYHKRI